MTLVPATCLLATLLPATLALTGCDDVLGSDDGDVTLTTDDRLYASFCVSDGDRHIDVHTPVFRVEPATAELRRPGTRD